MNIFDFMAEKQAEEIKKPEKPQKEPKKTNVFDYIKQINEKMSRLQFDDKLCSGYMLTLHYSHDRKLLKHAEKINRHLFYLNNRQVYEYFYAKIPKNSFFIRWPKKEKADVELNEEIVKLMEEHNMSRREALEYFI